MADWIVRLLREQEPGVFYRPSRDGRVFRTIFPALRTGLLSNVPSGQISRGLFWASGERDNNAGRAKIKGRQDRNVPASKSPANPLSRGSICSDTSVFPLRYIDRFRVADPQSQPTLLQSIR